MDRRPPSTTIIVFCFPILQTIFHRLQFCPCSVPVRYVSGMDIMPWRSDKGIGCGQEIFHWGIEGEVNRIKMSIVWQVPRKAQAQDT